MLETIKFFFLGLIQGITEPIPVSSSGHLLILNHYFGVGIEEQQQLGFAVLVNFASLLASFIDLPAGSDPAGHKFGPLPDGAVGERAS